MQVLLGMMGRMEGISEAQKGIPLRDIGRFFARIIRGPGQIARKVSSTSPREPHNCSQTYTCIPRNLSNQWVVRPRHTHIATPPTPHPHAILSPSFAVPVDIHAAHCKDIVLLDLR